MWSAEDALEACLRDIRSGDLKPEQLVIHLLVPNDEGGRRHHYFAAGVTFEQHIALLNVGLRRTMDEWLE